MEARADYVLLRTATGISYADKLFEQVYADVTGAPGGNGLSNDTATVRDTAGNDTFVGQVGYAELTTAARYLKATGFDSGTAFAESRSDTDTATIHTGTLWDVMGDWETLLFAGGSVDAAGLRSAALAEVAASRARPATRDVADAG